MYERMRENDRKEREREREREKYDKRRKRKDTIGRKQRNARMSVDEDECVHE